MSVSRQIYEDMILDHNRAPRNFMRIPQDPVCSAHGFNPICGDEFTVYLQIENDIIKDAAFDGSGCAISTASASLMTEAVKGRSVSEARKLFSDMHNMLTTGEELDEIFFKLNILNGVRAYPIRIKCATLAWHTMNAALDNLKETVTTE
ncbi:MAG: SUF system NifU family Fe-S cluster assembly protein [Gammaproteobacteria bacterium]|nr:SUF system NifU family Fe-S cluster assembly protein [Gammaproteobacteria bacterium]